MIILRKVRFICSYVDFKRTLNLTDPEKPPERPVSMEKIEAYVVSLATLVIVIVISVTLVCLVTLLAYKAWQVKHTNTYCVN